MMTAFNPRLLPSGRSSRAELPQGALQVHRAAEPSPASAFVMEHSKDVFSLMGVTSITWGLKDPTEVRISVHDPVLRVLADNVLRDTVDGARLVFQDSTAAERAALPASSKMLSESWADYPTNMVRAVAGMPGVTQWRWLAGATAIFTTATPDDRRRLAHLVNRQLGGTIEGVWAGECYGKSCDPRDRPPAVSRFLSPAVGTSAR